MLASRDRGGDVAGGCRLSNGAADTRRRAPGVCSTRPHTLLRCWRLGRGAPCEGHLPEGGVRCDERGDPLVGGPSVARSSISERAEPEVGHQLARRVGLQLGAHLVEGAAPDQPEPDPAAEIGLGGRAARAGPRWRQGRSAVRRSRPPGRGADLRQRVAEVNALGAGPGADPGHRADLVALDAEVGQGALVETGEAVVDFRFSRAAVARAVAMWCRMVMAPFSVAAGAGGVVSRVGPAHGNQPPRCDGSLGGPTPKHVWPDRRHTSCHVASQHCINADANEAFVSVCCLERERRCKACRSLGGGLLRHGDRLPARPPRHDPDRRLPR